MKQLPTSFFMSPEIGHLKAAPWPTFIGQFSRGVLTMAHTYGAAPFPWPMTYVRGLSGTAKVSLP